MITYFSCHGREIILQLVLFGFRIQLGPDSEVKSCTATKAAHYNCCHDQPGSGIEVAHDGAAHHVCADQIQLAKFCYVHTRLPGVLVVLTC